MSYFWCEKHKEAHRKGDDDESCLLVGPFKTAGDARAWNGAIKQVDDRAPIDGGTNADR